MKRKKAWKKKKWGVHWAHGSPHIANLQGGFGLRFSQGSQGEPLARELKTGARKLHHNAVETMDSVKIGFFTGLKCVVCSQTRAKCKYATGNRGTSGRMSPDSFVFAAKWDITREFTFESDLSFEDRGPIKGWKLRREEGKIITRATALCTYFIW